MMASREMIIERCSFSRVSLDLERKSHNLEMYCDCRDRK